MGERRTETPSPRTHYLCAPLICVLKVSRGWIVLSRGWIKAVLRDLLGVWQKLLCSAALGFVKSGT